jgi:hypothetical protein
MFEAEYVELGFFKLLDLVVCVFDTPETLVTLIFVLFVFKVVSAVLDSFQLEQCVY